VYNVSEDLQTFYEDHVRLGEDLRKKLADARDANIGRLKAGLSELGEENHRTYPPPYAYKNQGGYAMHTLNKAADDDYDIDSALLFEKDSLPEDPLAARQRIRDALQKKSGNFSKDPETRTNCVTVWYEEGYHIDLAIYRTSSDWWGTEVVEHASTEWNKRDPMEFTNWFLEQVTERSPKPDFFFKPTVAEGQLRRIVRFLKWFCRSRPSWSLPGGMVVSILAAETYRADRDRDDVSLLNTMKALQSRLRASTTVHNPVNADHSLTENEEVLNQVIRLREKLDMALGKLKVLSDESCTRTQARSAWDWVFNHTFWGEPPEQEEDHESVPAKIASAGAYPYNVTMRCELAKTSLMYPKCLY
jgi:Cyclic GMP-AMP synthase DncV-like, nucleotidyltransferase domain